MIVRIMGEGQLEVSEDHLGALNELDAAVESAVAAGDQDSFATSLALLLEDVRRVGTPLPVDALHDSDLILPPADATIEEVRHLLEGDGLIPG